MINAAHLRLMCLLAGWIPVLSGVNSSPAHELPPELEQALSALEDFTYDFDAPAYYGLLQFVQQSTHAPGSVRQPIAVNDWRVLVERPDDFRGLPVTVEGVVGRNKDPYTHARHPELGPVWQVELSRHDQPVTCTIIFTGSVADVPVGSAIQVTGYFVKVNTFPRQAGDPGLSALIVAGGPSVISRSLARSPQADSKLPWMVLAVFCGLTVAVFMLRSARRTRRRDLRNIQVDSRPRENLTADLAEWAERDPPDREPPPGAGADESRPD